MHKKMHKKCIKIQFKDKKLIFLMVVYQCQICNFTTPNRYNYNQHIQTNKHLQKMTKSKTQNVEKCGLNVENVDKKCIIKSKQNLESMHFSHKVPHHFCNLCCKPFSRADSLKRHLSICKLLNAPKNSEMLQNAPKNVENNSEYKCEYCQLICSKKFNLNRHYQRCKKKQINDNAEIMRLNQIIQQEQLEKKLVEKDLENKDKLLEQQQKTIELVQKMKPSVTNITNNSTNKTINYLNTNYGDMIAMDKFLHNLQYTEQLTEEERQHLLISYKDSGIELFARSFSHVMKENCRRQLIKEGLPEMDIIPLYCSDGNLRSHKEKDAQGWKTHYDDHSLNTMINISSQQVYQSCRKPLMIFGKERNKVFKQIKQDNHSQKEISNQLIENKKKD